MKNLKLLLFSLLLISTLAQCQTTPPLKLRSSDSFTQVDHFLNVKKRFSIPFSSANNLFCNGSYPLMFNTTEGKLKLYDGTSWINPFSLNLQEVLDVGNSVTNTGITFLNPNSNSFNVSTTGFLLSTISGTSYIDNAGLNNRDGFYVNRAAACTSLGAGGISLTNNYPLYNNRLLAANVTDNKMWTLPDASGTLALTTTDARPYKTIVATLSQSGINTPVIQYLMENTLGPITFTYCNCCFS